MFRSRRSSRLLVLLSLLWAVEASAARVSLLSFEGDRARSIRWRVAQALKRGGHTVLGFAPPSVRGSAAALRDYAEYKNVDLFVSGSSLEGPKGLQLELRFRGPDGKPVAQPLRLEADNLRGLVQELKGEGLGQIDGAVRGGSPGSGSSAELPTGRALPLPKRRARPKKTDDRPVLPGAAPVEEAPKAAPKRTPREVDLDEAVAGAAGGQTWDADGEEPRERGAKGRSGSGGGARAEGARAGDRAEDARATKKRSTLERFAAASAGLKGSSSKDSGSKKGAGQKEQSEAIDLDADTRGALEESPGKAAAAGDPLADPAPVAAEGSGNPDDPEPISIDDEPPAEEPVAKPKRKKRGLFAGKLSRKKRSEDGESLASSGGDSTLEDREPSSSDAAASGSLPNARISARAGFMRRSLSYSDDLYNRLRTPTTNGWVYRVDAALFPFAQPLKDRLSLIGSYEGALAGTVRDDRADRDFGVSYSEIEGGLRYRQPIRQHEIGVQLTAGRMSAGLEGSAATSGVPEVGYTLLNPSVDAGLHFGPLTLRASVAYQYTLGGLGELASAEWFPRAEGAGVKGQVGLELQLTSNIFLQASGAYRRFVLNMNSRPEDAREGEAEVAGGAVDLYTTGYFGVAFTL